MIQPRKPKSSAKKNSSKRSAKKKPLPKFRGLLPEQVTRADWKADFLQQHTSWTTWLNGDEPAYALPEKLVSELASEFDTGPLLTNEQPAEERQFAKLCASRHIHVVGVWRGSPIRNWPFATAYLVADNAAEPPDIHPVFEEKWAAAEGIWNIGNEELASKLKAEFRHAAVAWMGSCLFMPKTGSAFHRELNLLKDYWQQVPTSLQTPIHRIGKWFEDGEEKNDYSIVGQSLDLKADISAVNHFRIAYDKLLLRWGLSGFTTWDMANIPPPILGLELYLAQTVLPMDAVINFWPPQVHCPPEIELQEVLLDQQKIFPRLLHAESGAREWGRKYPLVRAKQKDGNASKYEKVMLMYIAERALRQRYGNGRGTSKKICEAFASWQELSIETVNNYRGRYIRILNAGSADAVRSHTETALALNVVQRPC